ncbi:SDR family oxidoreductase [Bacillus sp. FJAT-49732]|uniref:SDR family oxidoreductase n=1 Tax=Lederbergia citrisecunda TaxID=2833583 RepID=A0A942THZ9_9BACI|nr:SDR family NAD(P)-dependent oxidoreductase [Lederbergia citrisecunda]MBS4198390.1 SDR family oxidoreductase [Lederbergia citrisecunda]
MKTLLITGGNNGIGYFMVKEWLRNGHCVSVLDLHCDNLEQLQNFYPTTLIYFKDDVTDLESVKMAVNETTRQFGSIDYAIHNACLCLFKDFEEHSREDFDRVIDVNLYGAMNITKAVLGTMKNLKRGKVIFTSSGIGVTGYTNLSAYACSKGAIESLAKCLNLEFVDSGITFHIMHPPLTNTKSSTPLPIPKEFKASPERVGKGFIRNIDSKKFIITPSFKDALSIKFSYLFPLSIGRMLVKMTNRAMNR